MQSPGTLEAPKLGLYLIILVLGTLLSAMLGLGPDKVVGGGPGAPGVAAPAEEAQVSSSAIAWDEPIFNATQTSRAEKAEPHLAFRPSTPEELGTPARILFTRPEAAQRSDRILSLEYRNERYGRFLALEAMSQTNEAELAGIAAQCQEATGCEGEMWVETLDDGSLALFIRGPTAASVTFLDGAVRFDLIGPPDTFTPDRARELANKF